MSKIVKILAAVVAAGWMGVAHAFTTGDVPSDGVYRFVFGNQTPAADEIAVKATDVYDAAHQYTGSTFTYGFMGTQSDSYKNDVPWSLTKKNTAIDGFSVVQKQWIKLRDLATGVAGPLKADYEPAGASEYEGRYPVRFSFSAEEGAYYAITCTVVNVSSEANADVTLLSERCHIQAHHLKLGPGETRTFAWSVELFPNVFKNDGTYHDDAINVVVVGENAGLQSLVAVKQGQTSGTIRGVATDKMNIGKTMWLCDDSTGTDQAAATPFFSLQNYCGVGSGISRWAPANIAIRNQGEGGLATNANAHRQSCQLKPGDYLYVEYGHNENDAQSYTNNLELYLTDANKAGAKLVIVSAVERRYSWNSESQTWNRSLGGYAAAAEAWVEDKIAQGATNVAFVNLNKRYNDWQNEEIRRINTVNPDISLFNAISFYYRCAKGAHVDDTHINTAGTDQAAYWVWQEIVDRVAAGQAEGATDSQKIQAAVLADLVDGYQGTVGLDSTETNIAWSVTDDIVKAGDVPNEYWDTPVTSGFDYANTADVASVDTTLNEDGTITISGVTMRILNPGNYYKAVIDITDAAGVTKRYYTYSNYDVGGAGKMSGDLVTPEKSGFISNDVDKATISAADLDVLTVPAGGKAEVWMAVASASTWQVGDNGPCSPKYPVLRPESVLVQDDCSSTNAWTLSSNAADYSAESADGAITFHSSGARSDKKNASFSLYLPLTTNMEDGRYRISFRAYLDAGHIYYRMGDGSSTVTLLELSGTTAIGYQSTSPLVTVTTDAEGNAVPQAIINTGAWMDVDMIIDRTNARAWISVGGSDYVEWQDIAFLPGSYAGKAWNRFDIAAAGGTASYGAVDEVKVEKLPSVTYNNVTGRAVSSDTSLGTVTINGYSQDALTIFAGRDFMIKATVIDPDFYYFAGWQDGDGNTVSTKPNLYIPAATADVDYKAVFARYDDDVDRVISWDFSAYQGDFEQSGAAATITDQGLQFTLTSGDALTGSGLTWANSANNKTQTTIYYSKYLVFSPTESGTFTLKFSVDAYISNRKPTVVVSEATSASACDSDHAFKTLSIEAADTEYTLTVNLTEGKTYYIWPYSYNWSGANFSHNYTISSITYAYARPTTNRVTVNEGETLVQADPIKSNTGTITKKGAGTLVLVGTNTFSCPLTVAEGTVKLGDPITSLGTLIAHFDASVASSISYTNEVFEKIGDLNGSERYLYAKADGVPTVAATTGVMGGLNAFYAGKLRLYADAAFSSKPGSVFMVWRPVDNDKYLTVMGDASVSKYNIQRHNTTSGAYQVNVNGTYSGTSVYGNGSTAALGVGNDQLVSVNTASWIKSGDDLLYFGSQLKSYIGEVVMYTAALSDTNRSILETYLMEKWGIGSSVYVPVNPEADITVAAGATLDLGAQKPTVKSVTLEDGAILDVDYGTEGVVLTADTISVEGALVIKVDGETSTTLEAFVIDNADGTQSLKLVVPVYATLTVPTVANTTVQVTAGGRVWAVTDGAAQVPQGLPVTVTYSPVDGYMVENGTITLDALTGDAAVDASKVTVSELTCTWKGGASGDWSDADNWDTGIVPTLGTSKIAFTNDVTVTLPTTQTTYTEENLSLNGKAVTFVVTGSSMNLGTQTINQSVAFKDGTVNLGSACTVSGTGTITIKSGTLAYSSSSAEGNITCNLAFDASTIKNANSKYFNLKGAQIDFSSACSAALTSSGRLIIGDGSTTKVSGDGTVAVECSSTGAFVPDADFSAFKGSMTVKVSSSSKTGGSIYCNINAVATDFSQSRWSIYMTGTVPASTSTTGNGNLAPWRYKSKTIKYGQLSLNVPSVAVMANNYKGNTLEIGALDEDSYLCGTWASGANYPIIWVAPTATLTNTTANTYSIAVTKGGTVSFGGVTTGIPTAGLTFSDQGGYIRYESANFAAVTNAIKSVTAPLGWDVPEGETCVFDPDYIGEDITLMKSGKGILSVPENTVFASLSEAQQEKVTITGMAEGKRVKFTTDPETGKITVTAVDAKVEVPFFLVGGQSNTEGRIPNSGDNAIPSEYTSNENAKVMTGTSSFLEAWAPCSGGEGQAAKWAYDTPLYYYLTQNLGTIYVAKTAYGGTSVNPTINNSPSSHPNSWLDGYGNGYHWSADADFLAATRIAGEVFEKDGVTYDGQSMLKKWIANMDAAIDALVADGKTPVVKAIIWHQGESDKNNGNYAEDLHAVVTYVRNHLTEKLGVDCSNLPFFCGNVPKKSSLYTVNLDQQFTTVAETTDWNMHVADIYDMTMLSDVKHFTGPSAITFAKRMFNQMVDAGVITAEKLEVSECVRKPDFGIEHVVNNTTTWSYENKSGDLAKGVLVDIDGMYYHAQDLNSRKFYVSSTSSAYTLNWTLGSDTTPTTTKNYARVNTWYTGYEKNIISTTTAGQSNDLIHLLGVNVGRAGRFEMFSLTRNGAELYFNGKVVALAETNETAYLVHLVATNTVEGTYFIAAQEGDFFGARFVPDEEQASPIEVTIPASGVATFGNLYNCSFVLPEGLTAYAVNVDADNEKRLSLTELTSINLGDAVVLKGAAGTYTLTPGIGATYSTENLMVTQEATGVVDATSGDDFINFIVGADEDGNVMLTRSTGTTTLNAGEAFFSITEGDAHSEQTYLYEVLPPARYTEEVTDGEKKVVLTPYEGDTVVLTKTGEGTLTLVGNNDFAGEVRVKAGTVRLGSPAESSDAMFDFDASATDSIVYDSEGAFSKITDQKGGTMYLKSNGDTPTLVTDTTMGGKPHLVSDKLRLQTSSSITAPQTTLLAWHISDGTVSKYIAPLGDLNNSNWWVGRRNDNQNYYQIRCYNDWYREGYIWVNGVYAPNYVYDRDEVLSVKSGLWLRYSSTSTAYICDKYASSFGEIIAFSRELSDDERASAEAYLMYKWGIASSYTPIPTNAAVAVAAGATLDLGTQTPTVGTANFADSSVIAVDALTTEGTVVMKASYITLGKVVVKVADEELADAVATVFTDDYGIENLKLTAPTYVKLTVPTITDASVVVTANGTVRTAGEDGTYAIPTGVPVTVVYTSTRIGSAVTNGSFSYDSLTQDTAVDTTDTKLERVATIYTWADAGDHKWSTVKNWKVGEENAADYPSTLDTAVFPVCEAGVTNNVRMDVGVTVVAAKLEGDVLLTNTKTLGATTMYGAGMLYMNGAALSAPAGGMAISNDVTMVDGTYNSLTTSNGANIEIHGDLHGKGEFNSYQNSTWTTIYLYGDNSDFAGTVSVGGKAASAVRDCLTYMTTNSASAKAKWNIKGTLGGSGSGPRVAGTYKYGTLQGSYYTYVSGVTLEVGARNEDCSFASRVGQNDSGKAQYTVAFGLRKVGSATLTYTGTTGLADVEVVGGALYATNLTTAATSYKLNGGTLVVSSNAVATVSTDTEYAIEAVTNMVDTTYTVTYTLKIGPEVKPGEGEITPDPTTENTYVVTTESTNVTEVTVSNLPADATVKVPVNVTTVNGVTDASKVKVLSGNGTTDITGYLVITTTATGVTIGDLPTEGAVYEAIEATTLDDEEPIKLENGKAEITTGETIPGLRYTLEEGAALGDMADGDAKYGDGAAWQPEVGKSGKLEGATAGFFRIKVTK